MAYLYAIVMDGYPFVKIGFTEKDPIARLKELQTGNPITLRLFSIKEVPGIESETQIHRQLSESNHRDEWFRLDRPVLRVIRGWTRRQVFELTHEAQHFHLRISNLESKMAEFLQKALSEETERLKDEIYDLQQRLEVVVRKSNHAQSGCRKFLVSFRRSATLKTSITEEQVNRAEDYLAKQSPELLNTGPHNEKYCF